MASEPLMIRDLRGVADGRITAETAKTPQQKKLVQMFDTNFDAFQKLRERQEKLRNDRMHKLAAIEAARRESDAARDREDARLAAAQPAVEASKPVDRPVDLNQEKLERLLEEVLAYALADG